MILMKILENIEEYDVRRLPTGEYVILFYKQNDQEYLENCDIVTWFIKDDILTLHFEHQNLEKKFEFKNLEKRTRYLLNKLKVITFLEVDENQSVPALNYTVNKNKDLFK
tara:strand:- start:44695 stop:45024 length:330 start_codon:yes stop_codon:yes gene_type:complete